MRDKSDKSKHRVAKWQDSENAGLDESLTPGNELIQTSCYMRKDIFHFLGLVVTLIPAMATASLFQSFIH